MAEAKVSASSFSRNVSIGSSVQNPCIKTGSNGTLFVSTGISDLDKILGGGFQLGSLVLVMESAEAPHHMLLLRNFMSQGIVHRQSLLYGTSLSDPRGFLGTLPSPAVPNNDKVRTSEQDQEKSLRIAWQYKKYLGDNQQTSRDGNREYCNDFDLRKPLERHYFVEQCIDCLSFKDYPDLKALQNRCESFSSKFLRQEGPTYSVGRIAIQSLCAPQCSHSNSEWETLSFLRSLRTTVQSVNAVAIVSFPPSLLSPSFCKRLQHMADVLLSVRSIPDDDKELSKLFADYRNIVGFLNIHKVARINSQVPVILETRTYSIKLQKRRFLVLECLNQAPVDGASTTRHDKSDSCSSSKSTNLDF